MIRSMTAFHRSEQHSAVGALAWELRAVNHRYLEIRVTLPDVLRALEPTLRERFQQRLGRGRVEGILRWQPSEAESDVRVDWAQAHAWAQVARRLDRCLGHRTPSMGASELLRQPGVMVSHSPDPQALQQQAQTLFETALDGLVTQREREGQALADHLRQRAHSALDEVAALEAHRPSVNEAVRARLMNRLAELPDPPDTGRLEQELLYIAQRQDIDEELSRLRTHLDEVLRNLDADEPVGRRLDFLMQELNREANTVASKAADARTTRHAVELKVLIEQMREQIQNVE